MNDRCQKSTLVFPFVCNEQIERDVYACLSLVYLIVTSINDIFIQNESIVHICHMHPIETFNHEY